MSDWVVINDKGRIDQQVVQAVLRALVGAMGREEVYTYVVRNCGFALLRQSGSTLHVCFNPHTIGQATFVGLAYRLLDMAWRRAVAHLDSHQGKPLAEILPLRAIEAVTRLCHIVEKNQGPGRDQIIKAPRSLARVDVHPALTKILSLWQGHAGGQLPTGIEAVLQQEAHGHYFVARSLGSGKSLVMTDVGEGFPAHVRALLVPGIGRRLEDQPDAAYGRYCAMAYGTVAQSGVPSLEDVDAIMKPSNGAAIRRRYSRIILPFASRGSEQILLGVSVENDAVDLRRRAV